MNKFLFIPLFVCLLLSGCKKEDDPDALKKVVLEGYLFEGEQVNRIHLSELLPFGGTDTVADPINDAMVTIYWNGQAYPLVNTPGDSGYYYYPGPELQVIEGGQYSIEIEYFGQVAKATTTVPPPPVNLQLSKDTLTTSFQALLDSLLNGGSLEFEPDVIEVTWDNPQKYYYFMVVKSTDSTAPPIFDFGFATGFISELLMNTPTQEALQEIFEYDINHYGPHEVAIYRINQEYVDLYNSLDQDSRTLNEPLSNVENGLGVFTAFNGRKATFIVDGN